MNQIKILLFCFSTIILICILHIGMNLQQINKKLNNETNTFQVIGLDTGIEIYSNGE